MLDRTYQLELLNLIKETYPVYFDIRGHMQSLDEQGMRRFEYNLAYLVDHRLLDCDIQIGLDGGISMGLPTITKDGLDFLADDGGLSAMLRTVTVRLHRDDLQQLIEAKLMAMPTLQPTERKRFVDQLRSLPADATKQLVTELLKRGLDNVPDAVQLLQRYLS